MEKRHLQRLVGTLVLLGLAGVFLAFLVQTPESEAPGQDMNIPEPPKVASLAIEPVVSEQQKDAAHEQVRAEREALVTATTVSEPESEPPSAEPEPAAAEDRAPQLAVPAKVVAADEGMAGYVLQVASFSQRDNAEALSQRLRDQQYRAFVEASEHEGQRRYRVNLGPELRRQEIEQTQQRLQADAEFDYSGLIRRFVP